MDYNEEEMIGEMVTDTKVEDGIHDYKAFIVEIVDVLSSMAGVAEDLFFIYYYSF